MIAKPSRNSSERAAFLPLAGWLAWRGPLSADKVVVGRGGGRREQIAFQPESLSSSGISIPNDALPPSLERASEIGRGAVQWRRARELAPSLSSSFIPLSVARARADRVPPPRLPPNPVRVRTVRVRS